MIFNIRQNYPCGIKSDFEVYSSNSDSNCFRIKTARAIQLVRKNPNICNGCLYYITLKEGERIRIINLPHCINVNKYVKNPYIGMEGIVTNLKDGYFDLKTESSWLVGIKVISCKYELF
jgi:hypothetical protein